MATITTAARPPRTAREMAQRLGTVESHPLGFAPRLVRDLPEPAQRWLVRAIAPGTPLMRRAEFRMHGEIKLRGRWHDFTAKQILAPDEGFVWAARTRIAGLPVAGFDGYAEGVGTMRWQLLGVPIIRESGDGVTLSALDRLAAESVLLPTSLIGATWCHGDAPDTAMYFCEVHGRQARTHVTIDVAPDGRLRAIRMQRWGKPAGNVYALQPFAVAFDGEFDAGGVLVPNGIRASWPESGGEFFRAALDAVSLD